MSVLSFPLTSHYGRMRLFSLTSLISSPSGTPVEYKLLCLIVFHESLKLSLHTIFFVSDQQSSRIYEVPSALWDRWERSHSLREHPETVKTVAKLLVSSQKIYNISHTVQFFSAFPRGKLGPGGFLPIVWQCAMGRDYGETVSWIFLLALRWLISYMPGVWESLD